MRRGKPWLEGLEQEIREHIERETSENIERGMTPEEARHAALRKFGNIARVEEDSRAVWSVVWLEQLIQDVRYGARMLRRSPGFTAVAVATLALGIGMNTAVFSVVNAVLFRPLPYANSQLLIWLAGYRQDSQLENYVARADFLAWKKQARSFERMTAYGNDDLALVARGEASQERIASIAGDFWEMTGAQPALGRLFRAGEANVVVLSWALFERRFGGDAQTIGKTIEVDGWPFTIEGVLPKDFRLLFPQHFVNGDEVRDIDAFIPIPDTVIAMPQLRYPQWLEVTRRYGPAAYWVSVVGQLKADAPVETARAEMQTIHTRIAQRDPGFLRDGVTLRFMPLEERLVGDARRALLVLLVAVGFVLLIACVNIANLLVSRASTRQREIAIRTAVGAGRLRVIRQFLAESVLLSLLGCGAGLLLGHWALTGMLRLAPQAVPRLGEATFDARVLGFALAASLFTGVLFGLAPAISLWKWDVHGVLKSESGASLAGAGRIRVRGLLAAAEMALAIVLLTGAGLMLKSFWRMSAGPPGFAPGNVLVMRVTLSGQRYESWPPKQAYTEELLERLQSLPGVEAAGVDCGSLNSKVRVDGAQPTSREDGVFASIRGVSPGYLRAMGVPLVRGNWPARGSLFEVVVNEAFTRQIVRGESAGRHIGGSILNDAITGVVADFKTWQLDRKPLPEVYMPYERMPVSRSMRVVVGTSGRAAAMAPAVRKLISSIDRTQPVYEFQTLDQALSDSIAPRRFNLFLLGVFAATGLLLALIGIYGVIAYAVTGRTREIGIRLALGARRLEIVRLVVRQGMTFALAGILAGVAAGVGLTRLMSSLLYDVKPNDPWIFAATSLALAVTALLASGWPALRAALVDPLTALRHE